MGSGGGLHLALPNLSQALPPAAASRTPDLAFPIPLCLHLKPPCLAATPQGLALGLKDASGFSLIGLF